MAEAGSSLARSRVHRGVIASKLLISADRELVLLTALAAIILIFVVLTWYAALFGIVIWLVAVAALRMMAKSDPLICRVYLRHISYKTSYRATSSPWPKF
ncbi:MULTISPECIES: conjugal transfer protein TrbD [unclassified Rhizobium]|uniref:conjugal transfer protein TrbD n=1 Tax=unclassified Rhizobium TaxID=2613769 RepID=UPI001AE98EF2|nr:MULTISPECIES: conjugal transfer protein TrbD [unclassified Rhizobium]MBP2463922.1 type IV secretion system protein VirB3 [Rhizobium sp. PvP014]MBP2532288.1 type IV secretion system protein VirB3 [Rhizobium sp. PvP099]